MLTAVPIRKLILCALIACGVSLCAQTARADAPALRCEAVRVGQRVLVRVSLRDFVAPELARLIRLGLSGRIKLDATLLRRRRFWFDDVVANRTTRTALAWTPRRGFVLGGRRSVADLGSIDLGTLSVGFGQAGGSGLYLNIEAELQVVTVSSLRRTAGWITRKGDGSRPGLVKDRVIDLVVTDLARSAATSCEVRERQP